jgi:hypothetical protein
MVIGAVAATNGAQPGRRAPGSSAVAARALQAINPPIGMAVEQLTR